MFEASNNHSTNVPKRLIVGIDIAKDKHWASIDDGNGKPFAFSNDREGLKNLMSRIRTSQERLGFSAEDPVRVGLEPTGHYWKSLGYALKTQPHVELVLVNPYHTKLSKELDDNSPLKSDPKDSRVIRNLTREGKTLGERLPQGPYANLRRYFSLWNYLAKQQGSLRNRLEALLCEYFPEYEHCFFDFLGATSRTVLERYGLAWDLRDARSFALERLITKTSRGKISSERAQELWKLAHNTLGHQEAKAAATFELDLLLEEFKHLERYEESLELAMEKELSLCEESAYLLSFPGVSTVSASGFLGATGPLKDFHSHKALEKLAGLNLVEETSGKKEKSRRHFSKRGRDDLRHVLYLVALVAISKNDEFRELYQQKIKNHPDKIKMKVVGGFMVKTLRTLYSLGKNKCFYDGKKVLGDRQEQIPEHLKTNTGMSRDINVQENKSLCVAPLNVLRNLNPAIGESANSMNPISGVSRYLEDKNRSSNRILERFPRDENAKFQRISKQAILTA